jgi:hypothetical protein
VRGDNLAETLGLGWDTPALAVIETIERHLCDAEEFARRWLKAYQEENPEAGASAYRILDDSGKRLKAST